MKRQPYNISNFLCPGCHHVIPLPRKAKSERESGHIKDIYCPWCGKVQKTIEYKVNQPIMNGLDEYL